MFLFGAIGGGVVRWYRLSQENKKRSEIFTVILLQRVLLVLVLLIMGLTVLVFQNPFGQENQISLGLFSTISGACIVLILAVLTNASVMNYVDTKIASPLITKLPHFLKKNVDNLWKAISGYQNEHKALLQSFLLIALYRTCHLMFYYLLANAIGLNIPFIAVGVFFLGGSLFEFVPTLFNGLGFRELIFIYLGTFYSVSQEEMTSLSLLVYSFIILTSLIGGVIEFSHQFISKKI